MSIQRVVLKKNQIQMSNRNITIKDKGVQLFLNQYEVSGIDKMESELQDEIYIDKKTGFKNGDTITFVLSEEIHWTGHKIIPTLVYEINEYDYVSLLAKKRASHLEVIKQNKEEK